MSRLCQLILWELNSILMARLSFVLVKNYACCSREWKRSIAEVVFAEGSSSSSIY